MGRVITKNRKHNSLMISNKLKSFIFCLYIIYRKLLVIYKLSEVLYTGIVYFIKEKGYLQLPFPV
jgi:hypothetical protein